MWCKNSAKIIEVLTKVLCTSVTNLVILAWPADELSQCQTRPLMHVAGVLGCCAPVFNITTQGENHSYNTRQSDQIRTNRTRTHFADNRLKIYLPIRINSVPTTLLKKIATHSIHGFSSSVKRYYIGNYSNTCSIPNCYICQRVWKLPCLKLDRGNSHYLIILLHYTLRRLNT